jgi:dephospho-CoA kinase
MGYCIGLTGGIASGKSTVAQLFATLGIQIIDADNVSKKLTEKNQIAYKSIVTHYGTKVLKNNGELDRRQLRSIIFSDSKERIWLEQLLHPLIRKTIKEQVDSSTTPYCIVEIPLFLNKKNYPYIDRILLIDASRKVQIARVMQRDLCSREEALAILAAQPEFSARLVEADDVLVNDFGLDHLKAAVKRLHEMYLQKSR